MCNEFGSRSGPDFERQTELRFCDKMIIICTLKTVQTRCVRWLRDGDMGGKETMNSSNI